MNGVSGRATSKKRAKQIVTRRARTINTILLFVIFLALYALLQQSFLKGLLYGHHQESKNSQVHVTNTGNSDKANASKQHGGLLASNATNTDLITQSRSSEQLVDDDDDNALQLENEDPDSKDGTKNPCVCVCVCVFIFTEQTFSFSHEPDDDTKSTDDQNSKLSQHDYQVSGSNEDQASEVQQASDVEDKSSIVSADSSDPTSTFSGTEGEEADTGSKSKESSVSETEDYGKMQDTENVLKSTTTQRISSKMKFISIDPSSQGFNNQYVPLI